MLARAVVSQFVGNGSRSCLRCIRLQTLTGGGCGQTPAGARLYHVLRAPRPAAGAARHLPRWRPAAAWSWPRCHQSTAAAAASADYIPAPPRPPGSDPLSAAADTDVSSLTMVDVLEPVQQQLNSLGEPTLASLGLGGYWPPGLAQQGFELLHTSGLPWFGAIAAGTLFLRLCVFPLVVKSQTNAVLMHNNLPQMQKIQLKMQEARQMGNEMEARRYSNELIMFMKKKNTNPIKNLWVAFAQMPIFLSVFFGLRRMANLPLVSMKTGGALWFVDLTVPDPYFILPAITSLSMLAVIELGVDGAQVNSGPSAQMTRTVLRAIPFILFPFIYKFPAAILCYWCTSNLIGLTQALVLRVPAVRSYFNIPQKVVHPPETLPIQKKPFVSQVKESWNNVKISRELEDRQRYDEMRFKKAGFGPVAKTHKYDPTKRSDPPLK